MSSGIRIHLDRRGHETGDVPVRVEIFDQAFNLQVQEWLAARSSHEFQLEPGVYGVRASVSSGNVFEQAVRVRSDEMQDCQVPLYDFSPHESHEWAYLTQPIDAPGKELLSDSRYEGVWMRLWQRQTDDGWGVQPLPIHNGSQVARAEDGVSYDFQAPGTGFYAVQVGGPKIPWKVVALPSSYQVMVLVRPASAPVGRVHPLEVVVSSDDWQMESLLALLGRGDMSKARDLVEQSELAEELLYGKVRNAAAAAVGGYFLLRVGSQKRLHNWANNLAEWFQWMPDGAIIHAWQHIAEARLDRSQKEVRLKQARDRLLEAVRRGFPLYTEGLRLLRDGLLLFARTARGEDQEIGNAFDWVSEYAAVADWSASTTTFTGEHPDKPSAKSRRGKPRGKDPLIYVYDVPLREAIRRGVLKAGEELIAVHDSSLRCTLDEQGMLNLPDGRSFKSLGAMDSALTGEAYGAWWSWLVASTGQPLGAEVQSLRILPDD